MKARLLSNSWLLIPFSVVGLVVVLALTQKPKQPQHDAKNGRGLVETFTVTDPGKALPPPSPGVTLPGTTFPNLGQKHVPESQRVKYNSNPPTSGPHYERPAAWGIYDRPPLDERLVHNLEHGGIIISYNPDRLKGEELAQIKTLAKELTATNPRIVVTPRKNLDTAIVLTAWGYLQKLDRFDSQKIKAFYDAHIARSPECQQGQCPL
jgi:hypothetical protein